jgi:hypothetical protein
MPFNALFSFLIRKRLQQIELFVKDPHLVQLEVFHNLLQAARYTEWGKRHEFSTITTVEEFKRRVPVQEYEQVRPWVERLRRGEQNLLWPTDIRWFAKSSGTTGGRSKYIPVSRESLEDCHYKGGKDLIALHYAQFPASRLYQGMSLVIGGSSNIEQFRPDAYSGDLSAIIVRNLPLWVEYRRTPAIETALMDQWEQKIERLARETMREDVRCIAGVPSWTLVLLKRVLELTGCAHVKEVWPDLELFMHGGVSFRPYRSRFEELIPDTGMNYLESYNASEGFFAVQDRHRADDLLLMLDYGIFYEFMPLDQVGRDDPKTLGLHEVRAGEQYALVISTNAGLWRYLPGDTVRFTSTDPYRIQVSGRTRSFINAFGEELIVDNADRGIAEACAATGAVVRDYTAGPVYMANDARGGHQWAIEFERRPDDLERFIDTLDRSLRAVNSDYDAKRTGDMALRRPVVHVLPDGTFHAWLKARGKLGGQHKVPRLRNDREILDSLPIEALP